MRRHFRLQFQPVVRPKTPRGDGNFSDHLCGISGLRSSDPKPREGTETRDICCPPGEMLSEVVRPKTPRGDGNRFASDRFASIKSGRQTQNPERGRKLPRRLAITTPTNGRQTQNPERGRKQGEQRRRQPGGHGSVVRPKTPRGDGNLRQPFRCDADGRLGSSDPKPREGTETRKRRASSDRLLVVRPKTPRGDGNKRNTGSTTRPQRVVRPKTPRGDGNFSDHLCGISGLRSSDPKPREGTETLNNAQ
ncbi:Uncharacterised protein [Mycobacterium tuberculosis]|nr:Uncharacterised protein [Mycobacterium tuberculosis]